MIPGGTRLYRNRGGTATTGASAPTHTSGDALDGGVHGDMKEYVQMVIYSKMVGLRLQVDQVMQMEHMRMFH